MSHIIAARRSPIAPRGGAFAALQPHEIAAPVIAAVLRDAGLGPEDVDELICANGIGPGGNVARSVALAAGLPERVAGLSLDRQCAGGLDAVRLGDAMIRAGLHRVVIAGGAESYSLRPVRLRRFADGHSPEPYEQAPFTPWPERDPDMAEAAAALAARLGISRQAQEDWAMQSHARARATQAAEIVPMAGLAADPFARDLTPRLCARAPVIAGSVTAATMAVAADGAAFVLLVHPDLARGRQASRVLSGAMLGGDPTLPGLAPVAAINAGLAEARLRPEDLALAEIMEAFAVQAIACQRGAGLDPVRVNPGGGALARGHPIGASGAVLAVRLHHQLLAQGGAGLAAIAAAGGIGGALVLGA